MQNLQMMEMLLKMKNPDAYNQYMQFKNSGKSPQQIIDELMNTGRINQDILNKAKNMMNNGEVPGNSNNGGYTGPRF